MSDPLLPQLKLVCASHFDMPKKPDTDEEILRVLVEIWKATGRQNDILRNTETNNERRHKELLQALSTPPIVRSMVFVKKRREKIT